MASTSGPGPEFGAAPHASRYHHFVPQFILRNFSHPYRPPNQPKSKRKPKKNSNGLFTGEKVLNAIRIDGENGEVQIVEVPVKRSFGIQDMYIQTQHAKNVQRVEEELSGLEAKSAEIVAKIKKNFEAKGKNGEVWLKRGERDVLRKFIFIQKFRRDAVRKKFDVSTAKDYVEGDSAELEEYMLIKGFDKPIEVWLDSIRGILAVEIDVEGKWQTTLMDEMYPPHAFWFSMNMTQFYMAFCTPEDEADEYLMTENGYGIYEGPASSYKDVKTGETTVSAFTEFHIFAHISPKLTIILRSALLSNAEEDVDPIQEMVRKFMRTLALAPHENPKARESILHDLPIQKARNSYNKYVDGRIVPSTEGSTPLLSERDKFFFTFFPIAPKHVNKINAMLLEEAVQTSMIVFRESKAACRALRYFLEGEDEEYFKNRGGKADVGAVLKYLKKLEKATVLLGGNLGANIHTIRSPPMAAARKDAMFNLFRQSDEAIKIYKHLTQSEDLDLHDFDVARNMLRMRIKVDSWSRGLEEKQRNKIREDIRVEYCKLPIQYVWIYLKRIRFMMKGFTVIDTTDVIVDTTLPKNLLAGPEDVIAKMDYLFAPGECCRIMYHATIFDNKHADPAFGFDPQMLNQSFNSGMMRRFAEEKSLSFGIQGSICDCGIKPVEAIARECKNVLQNLGGPNFGENDIFFSAIMTGEERLELAIRYDTLDRLEAIETLPEVLENKDEILWKELLGVLFNIVFPLFASK